MKQVVTGLVAALALAGCKADEVSIEIKEAQIRAAAEGGQEMVEFEAVFSNFGDLEADQRAQIDAIQAVLERYIAIDDFELELTDMGYDITIEGEIPITGATQADAPYFVSVSPSPILTGTHRVQLRAGRDFAAMEADMRGINFMLAPDAFHPTEFVIRGDGLTVLAPAVQVEGTYHLLWSGTVNDRLRLKFRDGAFDEVGAGFFVK